MIKFLLNLFRKKKPISLEDSLKYPEGKRYYKETHNLRKTMMDDDALKIIHRLNKFGHKSYLVGGCLRDMLLEKKPKDFDVATSATPNQIKNVFNNCRIIGKRFKIVHVIFKGKIIEVTTFRSLPEHRLNQNSDHTKDDLLLKRDNNFGNSKEDAARRDFTVNALYYDPRNESIIDYVGGLEDIQNKILRVIGEPNVSFKEDPVRMLRAVKISVLLGLTIEKKTKTGIRENRLEIAKASTSRMLEEYNKIFRTWETANIFKGLAEHHLLEVLFKEVVELDKHYTGEHAHKHFFQTHMGKLLLVADRKLKEREELTPVIFFALIFSDLVTTTLSKESGNMVPLIKAAIDPICKRLEIPKRDQERLIKIYASQKRFMKTSESNKAQNELFRSKDYFYESFMYFKILAEVEQNEEALQSAFFWEISTRIRPAKSLGKQIGVGHRKPDRDNNKNRKHPGKPKNPEDKPEVKGHVHPQKKHPKETREHIPKPDHKNQESLPSPEPEASVVSEEPVNPESTEQNPKKKKFRPRKYRYFNKKKNGNSGNSGTPPVSAGSPE
jgi:poly(A) polymerase